MGKRLRRIAAFCVAGAVVAGGAGTAYAAMSSSGPAYRLASVTPAEVTAALHVVGTLTPVRQADVAFATDGTVATVAVKPGQRVTAGQTLGTLDTTSLEGDLTAAQSTLADANLRVDNDIASQNSAASGSGSGGSGSGGSGGSGGSNPASSLRPLQQAVLKAQRRADSALAQAKGALGQARQACAPRPSPTPTATPPSPSPTAPSSPGPTRTPSPGPTGTPAGTATGTTAATGTTTATGTTAGADATAAAPTATPRPVPTPRPSPPGCAEAMRRALDAETAVLRAEQTLSARLTALARALSNAVTAAGKSSGTGGASGGAGATGGGAAGSGDSGTGGTGGGTRGGGGGSAGPVSAEQLAADQASADAAAAQVAAAQQNLSAATAVSPISGTVVTVGVSPGGTAGPGSTAFVVAGLDSYEVVTEVPVTDMPELKVGQRVSIQADGSSTALTGSVVSIGLVPDTSASPAAYPVTIGLTGHPSGLHAGGYANVTITTAQSRGVSVPTSAVHYSGHVATVTVYAGGKTRIARVTVGTRGPVMTRIASRLKVGQQVVLADLSKPLPTNNEPPGPGGHVIIGGGPG